MIKNLTEEAVSREYERLRPQFPNFCGCDVCHADVLVFALNRVPSHYVATLQ
ncbi:MAG: late competence development ComFB family protein, partial [Gemmatimonadales bacterium]